MEADQPRTIVGEPVQQLAARRNRLVRHMVRDGFPLRMLEGNQRVRENVTSDNQSLTAGKLERHMALRVTGRIDDTQASNDLFTGIYQFHFVLDRREVAAGSGDKTRAFGGQSASGIVAAPEIPLGSRNVETGPRHCQLVEFIDGAP